MNPEQLLAHFARVSDAPDAIPRLRRFILDLAVRGRLVRQDPQDEPAAELLKRIHAENASRNGGKRKQSGFPTIQDSATPFSAPVGWVWLRFGSIHILVRGVTYTKSDVTEAETPGYLPILRANNIGESLNFEDLVFVRKECISSEQTLRRGDYLIALSSGSKSLVGKAAFVTADYAGGFGGFCGVVRLASPAIEPFAGVFLSSRLYRDAISKGSRGIGINNLKRETLDNILFPLPPLTEQHRIVAKVDELMALCDRLEAALTERDSRRDRLVSATLHRLNNGADAHAFRDQARFTLDHLPRLTTQPKHIQQLRQTILNLAVRGRLVPKDPNDEPVSELLKRVQAEKERLIAAGKIRDQQPLPENHLSDASAQIPQCWRIVRLVDFVYLRSGIAVAHGDEMAEGDIPFLKVADLSLDANDNGIVTSSRFVSDRYSESIIESGSIVFPKRGGAIATNRKRLSHIGIVCDSNLMAMKPFLRETIDYLQLWFSGFDLWKLNSGTSVPQINNKDIYPLSVPIPPLAEQHRIVAKVDELMALCDRLKSQLTTAQTESRRLLEAVLHEALAPAETALQVGGG